MDVNGTIALDGILLEGVLKRISHLRDRLTIHLLTADTHGRQVEIDRVLQLKAIKIKPGNESEQKAHYVQSLGAERVVAIGQGANDAGMLQSAALGICVMSTEGLAVEALHACNLLMPDILSALDLLEMPMRIIASLRK